MKGNIITTQKEIHYQPKTALVIDSGRLRMCL